MNNSTKTTPDNDAVTEYGVRWKTGANSTELERVMRKNGGISLWETEFVPNVGSTVRPSPFDGIDLFTPQPVTDALGNVFRRFGRFYVSEQTTDEYEYIWVCKTPANPSYRLPRAFYRKGNPHWNYVDIGVYEGSTEIVDGISLLTSKSGRVPTVNISRDDAFIAACRAGLFTTASESNLSIYARVFPAEFYKNSQTQKPSFPFGNDGFCV